MYFAILNENEFDDFVKKSEQKNFFQTSNTYKRFLKEKRECYLVGIKENDDIIAASLIANANCNLNNKKSFEAFYGFIIDYYNIELLRFFTKEIIAFLKDKNAYRLVITPYITKVSRDMFGNITPKIDNRSIITNLSKCGFYQSNDSFQMKWLYCLDINNKTSEELFSDFRSSTKNNINKTLTKFKLNVKSLKKEELIEFKKITSSTSSRREFGDKSLSYYENMYDYFKENVVFKLCELNCDLYIQNLENEIDNWNKKIEELSDSCTNKKKKDNMKKDIQNNIGKIKKTMELKKEKGNIIPLACAMFMLYGDEVIYLFSGSYIEYMSFCAQYLLQWDIIKYASENGYKRYNMYGILDVFNNEGKDHGVLEFKQGFGGHVEELLGAFTISID